MKICFCGCYCGLSMGYVTWALVLHGCCRAQGMHKYTLCCCMELGQATLSVRPQLRLPLLSPSQTQLPRKHLTRWLRWACLAAGPVLHT
jgi:hypothetical protein